MSCKKVMSLCMGISTLVISVLSWAAPTERPNFVIVMADDMTYTDSGCYGNDEVQTPNIDKLAAEGMRFTHAYSTMAKCSPTRQLLFTGLYPLRSGAYPQRSKIYDGVKTMPVYFKEMGYRIAIAGKTHYSPVSAYPFEVISDVPVNFSGFEEFLTRDDDQPFCLVVTSTQPHTPWDAGRDDQYDPSSLTLPPNMADTPRTRELLALYYSEVSFLDRQVGTVMSLLEKTNKADNTLVLFLSEQGAAVPFAKWTLYDAGIRAQCIARWPGKIESGATTEAMVQYHDVLPTFMEAAGDTKDHDLDGESFLDVLMGEKDEHRSQVYGIHTNVGVNNGNPYPIRAIRDKRYKLIWNILHEDEYHNNLTELDRKWFFFLEWEKVAGENELADTLVKRYKKRPEYELYDTHSDPYEMNNLAASEKHQIILSSLKKDLHAWLEEQGDKGVVTEERAVDRIGIVKFKKNKNKKK